MPDLLDPAVRTVALAVTAIHADEAPASLALDLARHFAADLVGLLLEDEALLRAAALPLAVEISRSGDERPFDPMRLERSVAGAAQRLHAALSAQGGRSVQIRRLRGTPLQALAEIIADIVVFAAPPSRWRPEPSGQPLLVHASGVDPARLDAVAAALQPHTAPWPWEHLPWSNDTALLRRVQKRRPSLLLAGMDASVDPRALCDLILALDCPVILLR